MVNIIKKFFGFNEYKFDYLGKSKIFYIISLVIIIPGLVMMLANGLNLGIDFTGGTKFNVTYTENVALEDVRETVTTMVTQTPSINVSEENHFIIRTEALDSEQRDTLKTALGELGTIDEEKTGSDFTGPTIGEELLSNARWALIIAGIFMLVYITFRFKLNYAITAIVALAHDVIVLLSIFAIFRFEVNSYFVAAILTIVGYSINNTIVIFDRIRENTGYYNRKEFGKAINQSINQTLTRNINTVLTVLLLLIPLLIFGGETTKIFALALTVGMFTGFYSSVFLVGNILNFLNNKLGNKWSMHNSHKPRSSSKAATSKGR